MSFITLCESANEDLLEHIVEEATIKFLIECVDQEQDDLIESLVYCVQCYHNEEEIDDEIFEHVFENFYDFIDAESMIYETVLFEGLSEEEKFDREVARRNQANSGTDTQEKKNIFKRALGAIGTGISKITPGFLKRKPADVTSEIKQKTPGKIGKLASAAYTAVRHPGQTLGKVKDHYSLENRADRLEKRLNNRGHSILADKMLAKRLESPDFKGTTAKFLIDKKNKYSQWRQDKDANKLQKLNKKIIAKHK